MPSQRNQVIVWYPGYVTSGMVARFQGSNNTGQGHSATATVWKDLIDGNDAVLSTTLRPGTRQWGPNYFESIRLNFAHFFWLTSAFPPEFSPEESTVEVVFMPYVGADRANGGDVFGFDNVPTSPFVSIGFQMGALNGESLFEETATFVITYTRVLVANTLYSLAMTAFPFNPVPASNGKKQVLYDGVLAFEAPRIAPFFVRLPEHRLALNANPVIVSTAQVFFGRIYEVRVYNRVLSPREIAHNAALDRAIYGLG